jgi:hypothetical protein
MKEMTDQEAEYWDDYYTKNTIMPDFTKPGYFARKGLVLGDVDSDTAAYLRAQAETPVSKKSHYNPPLTLAEAKAVIAERIRRKENGETIEDSSSKFAGCLNGKNIFKGDPVEIQRKLRDEWN